MTVIWEKIKKNIIDTLSEAIDKTEELTSVGRTKLQILQLEHQIEQQYTEMGKLVYQSYLKSSENLPPEGKLTDIKKAIDALEQQLREKEKELVKIREEGGVDLDA